MFKFLRTVVEALGRAGLKVNKDYLSNDKWSSG